MIYAYIRVSTDQQETKNQRFELEQWAKRSGFAIDEWIDEVQSGGKDYKKRALYPLMKRMKRGDRIICAELSRLGRTLMMIMEILKFCMDNGVEVWTHKDNYRLADDIQSKVLAFAFGISAEIERKLISQRTKEALARKRSEGVILGRPRGRKSSRVKLTGREDEVDRLLARGWSRSKVARRLKVHRITLRKFLADRGVQ